jgi:adenosylhomocysteinase
LDVPKEVDREVALRKLRFLGKEIDTLTEEQIKYLSSAEV